MGNATSVLGVEADIRLGSSPARFWEACRSGDASALDEELKRHPSLLNRRTNGQTAVMRLAELGDVEALAVLARHVRPAATLADPCGAPPRALTLADLVNQTNGKNQTALMTACWEGNHDVVKLLVAWVRARLSTTLDAPDHS